MKYIHPSTLLRYVCANTGQLGIVFWRAYTYRSVRGRWPNFKNPKDLSEHILAMMNNKSFERYAEYADKVKVRDYIKSKGLGNHLLDVYGVWEKAEDIDFDTLPPKFALKPNNGCGGHVFCHDKTQLNREATIKELDKNIRLDKYNISYRFEPHYKKISPKIYCEELIETTDGSLPVDYKFMCVKGQIADCLIVSNRTANSYNLTSYDQNWVIRDYLTDSPDHNIPIPKPKNWEKMKTIAEILSKDFDFVRVDLYEYKNQVFIGELTFSPQGGQLRYYTDKALLEMGNLMKREK